ncbi:unnamed protein product [Onchocerca flexuosa]|uniref:Solute carrier family 40 protein n=1 Tax=Onchocerca flexuosa TaxID=387005 RepID=A0A183HYG5_9BILA|nr:unnamed protein product [Onchocerca flexuosa]
MIGRHDAGGPTGSGTSQIPPSTTPLHFSKRKYALECTFSESAVQQMSTRDFLRGIHEGILIIPAESIFNLFLQQSVAQEHDHLSFQNITGKLLELLNASLPAIQKREGKGREGGYWMIYVVLSTGCGNFISPTISYLTTVRWGATYWRLGTKVKRVNPLYILRKQIMNLRSMDRMRGEGGRSLTREMTSDKWRTGYRKVNLAGKGSKDSFPTGTTDIPPGILIVIHSLFEVIAITATYAAFPACITLLQNASLAVF